jgi:hypothetical protein
VIVDHEPHGSGRGVQGVLEDGNLRVSHAHQDHGVVRILDDRAGQIINKAVEQSQPTLLASHELTQEADDDQVQVR